MLLSFLVSYLVEGLNTTESASETDEPLLTYTTSTATHTTSTATHTTSTATHTASTATHTASAVTHTDSAVTHTASAVTHKTSGVTDFAETMLTIYTSSEEEDTLDEFSVDLKNIPAEEPNTSIKPSLTTGNDIL